VLLNNDAVPGWTAGQPARPFEQPAARSSRVTGKVVFLPASCGCGWRLDFSPGPHDSRSLGVRISSVTVNGRDVLREVLWERLTFGAEGPPDAPFFWTAVR